jgi:hypothetical protein
MADRLNLLDRPRSFVDGLAAFGMAGGLTLPGTAGNYASTPDSVLNSVTGDIDIRVCAKLTDWTPSAEQNLVAKYGAAGQRSFQLSVFTNGNVRYISSMDGTANAVDVSQGPTGFADGAVGWVRVTHDVDNGSGLNVRTFYTSPDGVTWTVLGSASSSAGVTSIFDSTSSLEIGSRISGTQNLLTGTVYYAEVRNGIDGPVAVSFDASQVASSGGQTPATVNGWTWNGTALYKRDDYVRLPGTSGNYLSWPDTAAVSVTGDIDIRAKVSLDDWTPGVEKTLVAKWNSSTSQRAYELFINAAGNIGFRSSVAGTAATVDVGSSTAPTVSDGANLWIRATLDVDDGAGNNVVKFYTSADGVTWVQLGDTRTTAGATSIFDSSAALEIGSKTAGTLNMLNGNVYAAEVRNGIDGTVVASFDARRADTPWTILGAGWSWEGASFAGKPAMVLSLPGTSGNYASTPDTAGVSVTGDIDIRVKATLDVVADLQALFSKRNYDLTQGAYSFKVNAVGQLEFSHWAGGVPETRSQPVTLTAGTALWLRVTLDVDNGATQHVHAFYTSTDGVTWTQQGAPQINAGVTSIDDTTSALTIGALTGQEVAGKVHYAEVRNGIDGPIVARFDPTAIARTGTRTPTTTVQPGGTPNLLTPNQASIETDATGWLGDVNAPTIARSTAQFLDGAASLSVTATAVGPADMTVQTTPVTTAPVVPGKAYTIKASFRAAAVARTCSTEIRWYQSDGTTAITSVAGTGSADTTSGWTEVTVTAVAPALAAYARVRPRIAAALLNEVHYVDRISLVESAATWTVSGAAWDWVAA